MCRFIKIYCLIFSTHITANSKFLTLVVHLLLRHFYKNCKRSVSPKDYRLTSVVFECIQLKIQF